MSRETKDMVRGMDTRLRRGLRDKMEQHVRTMEARGRKGSRNSIEWRKIAINYDQQTYNNYIENE